jgi:hypothetical protein
MKNIFVLILGLISLNANSQKCKNLIFRTSDGFLNRKKDTLSNIKAIEYKIWKNALELKYENGNKELVKNASIWGYQDEKCVVSRWIEAENKFFYIRESSGIVIYLGKLRNETRSFSQFDVNMFWGRNHPSDSYPFFSKTLDSEPFVFNWEKLENIYKEDECFMKKLQNINKSLNPAYELEKDSKRLKINILYKECHL